MHAQCSTSLTMKTEALCSRIRSCAHFKADFGNCRYQEARDRRSKVEVRSLNWVDCCSYVLFPLSAADSPDTTTCRWFSALSISMWVFSAYGLSPVHTSNNVEATFDFVEATFYFVANNGINVERVIEHVQFGSTLWKGRNFVRHCCRNRQHCCQKRQQCQATFDSVEKSFDL